MNKKEKGYALVSMTNGDVYYIDERTTKEIAMTLNSGGTGFVQFVDMKSGAEVALNVANVSSIVVRSNDHA